MKLDTLIAVLTAGAGAAFIYIFISIAVTGGYWAGESNRFILSSEIIMGFIYLALGLIAVVRVIKR